MWAERHNQFLKKIITSLFIPAWFYYNFINKSNKTVLLIRSEIFGIQMVEFQAFNQLATRTSTKIYFNHHPIVIGRFIFSKQMEQILALSNTQIMAHVFVIMRLFADNINCKLSVKFGVKRKFIIQTLRNMGNTYSLLQSYNYDRFPLFTLNDLNQNKSYIRIQYPLIAQNKFKVAVQARTGNFPRYKTPKRINDVFRKVNANTLEIAIRDFGSDKIQYIRIGFFEKVNSAEVPNIIDLRHSLSIDEKLQLSILTSCIGYFGSSNGPLSLFAIQKLPCLLLSVYPIDIEYPRDPKRVVCIPKLIWDHSRNTYLSLEEQFNHKFLLTQNKYNDQLLLENNLEPKSLPQKTISEIFANWQDAVLLNQDDKQWLDKMTNKTEKLRDILRQPNLPSIPVEYFDYLEKFRKRTF